MFGKKSHVDMRFSHVNMTKSHVNMGFFSEHDVGGKSHVNMQHLFLMGGKTSGNAQSQIFELPEDDERIR
jgi:hypothetical protein